MRKTIKLTPKWKTLTLPSDFVEQSDITRVQVCYNWKAPEILIVLACDYDSLNNNQKTLIDLLLNNKPLVEMEVDQPKESNHDNIIKVTPETEAENGDAKPFTVTLPNNKYD